MKPHPTRAFPAAENSPPTQPPSPYPPPIRPSPPAFDTAAASRPPAIMPIGAEMIGCSMSNRSVSRVRSRIDGSLGNSLRRHPQDDDFLKSHRWHFGHQNVERPFWV